MVEHQIIQADSSSQSTLGIVPSFYHQPTISSRGNDVDFPVSFWEEECDDANLSIDSLLC